MPAGKLAEHFDPQMGRPTKERYSMAGLLCIMEFRNWTHEEAADAYMFNIDAQDALNLNPEKQSLCRRTIERYIKLFRDDELAQASMHDVTGELVQLLELDVSKQRLDSTHVESNMAKFGRMKLMATAIRRQCDVVDEKVVVKKHTGGDIVCNPSDPDATFDGHKGSGYQVQLSETCSPDNNVQLIVNAIPETAVKSDSAALEIVIDDLKERGLLPDRLLADTAYGSDDNDILCRSENISLVSPTSGKCPAEHVDPDAITVSDFRNEDGEAKDEYGRTIIVPTCVECPAGQKPHRSFYVSVRGTHSFQRRSGSPIRCGAEVSGGDFFAAFLTIVAFAVCHLACLFDPMHQHLFRMSRSPVVGQHRGQGLIWQLIGQ